MEFNKNSHVDTCRYTSYQHGVSQQKNRHIVEKARTLMAKKNMLHSYWTKAMTTTLYIMNKTPTKAMHDVEPEKKYTCKKQDVSYLKMSKCIAYAHVPEELYTKLDSKAKKCIFIGYSPEKKGYIWYNIVTRQLIVGTDVGFDEMRSWYIVKKWSGLI